MTIEMEKSNWPLVILTILAGVVAAAHVGKAPPSLPLLRAELDLSIVHAGWVVSVIAAIAMASGVFAGMLADRMGHRKIMILGLLTMAVSGGVGSIADDTGLLLASRFFEGVGFISIAVSAPSLIISAVRSHHRQLFMGVLSVWVPGGMALSMLISPLILGPLGWRGLWLFWAISALVLVALFLMKTDKTPSHIKSSNSPHSFIGSLRLILKRRSPMIMALNFCVYGAQWGSMMVWIPSFLVEQRSMDISTAAILGGLVVTANVPGNLMGSWLLHRGVERCHIIAGIHLVMGLCAVGVFSDSLGDNLRFGLVLLFSHSAGYLSAAMFASVPIHSPSPQQFGATNGLLLQGSSTGNFFGPPAVAAVVAALGNWNGVIWFMVVCAGIGFVSSLVMYGIEKQLPMAENAG
jgi:MFS family permease